MKGRPVRYSPEELAWLEANQLLVISEYATRFAAAFGRTIDPRALHALRKRKGWKTGRNGQFVKGAVPANKGKVCPPGKGGRHPNAQRTQFKKGQIPHTYRGVGHERVDSKDGYVILIVAERNPWTGAATKPVHKHRWLWEQTNGPIPDGMALKCLDGNKQNTDPSNWELVPRALLLRLNGGPHGRHVAYDDVAPELKPAVMAAAKLGLKIRQTRRSK